MPATLARAATLATAAKLKALRVCLDCFMVSTSLTANPLSTRGHPCGDRVITTQSKLAILPTP